MEILAVVLLFQVLSGMSALDKSRMEKIRLLYKHDGIEMATVHISYPHLPSMRRLTKREAKVNLLGLPRPLDNLTVKVTLASSRRVLDLHLRPSQLHFHGALVKVKKGKEEEEEFVLRDEGCHFQGLLDEGPGMVSVHFCDGVLVGAAHGGDLEYYFHSHQHRETDRAASKRSESTTSVVKNRGFDDSPGSGGDEELYHTIVSWKSLSKDLESGEVLETPLINDYVEIENINKNEKKKKQRNGRKKRQTGFTVGEDTNVVDDEEEKQDLTKEETPSAPTEGGFDDSPNTDYKLNQVPVAEFGIIVDEDFLRDHQFLYPTRDDIIRMLMIKYTAVQALYGNPDVTGFNLKIEIKLLYLWEKNPSYYAGSKLTLGQRMGAGKKLSDENAMYKSTDLGTIFTSQAPLAFTGMAFLGGACRPSFKTYATRQFGLNWNTEAHELGHTLGLSHVPKPCVNSTPPFNSGFMNAYRSVFQPCYAQVLNSRLKTNALSCLYKPNVNTTNIPAVQLQATFPVLALGLNYYCRTSFWNNSIFVFEGKQCAGVLCAVTEESDTVFSMAQVSTHYSGRPCGSDGQICMGNKCVLPSNTTMAVKNPASTASTWSQWSAFAVNCTSACGVGVQISSRQCSNHDRPEACEGQQYRARLCNMQPCPGDDLMTEQELRADRANYICSLVKARANFLSKYLLPSPRPARRTELTNPMWQCLVSCGVQGLSSGNPAPQRTGFGTVLQTDGTPCGPVRTFQRYVQGITARCLRGQCRKFGCDGLTMEQGGKVKDMCGVCGGSGSTCKGGRLTVQVGSEMQLIAELPAGTTDIQFAVKPDSEDEQELLYLKLALMDKEDSKVIMPGDKGRWNIITNDLNPLRFAGTHWTTVNNVLLSAPGPLDQPMKIKVINMKRVPAEDIVVVWAYTPPRTVPSPPSACSNNGMSNVTNGGCMCAAGYHGRQCEFQCHDLCFNGGVMQTSSCKCDCSINPHTSSTTRCGCVERFSGPDCKKCVIQHCFNNGILNSKTCQCQCTSGCDSKMDCSGCNYNNKKLPGYIGHYGRGSLEAAANLPDITNMAMVYFDCYMHNHHKLLVALALLIWCIV